MAEGLLEGFLGGEDEGPEGEAGGEPRVAGEAFAAAVAADQAGRDPGVARATALRRPPGWSVLRQARDAAAAHAS
ncbi:MAG: hypothetical protein JWO83_3944 [Caulobacteraceae bacterium]|nr:hypothetical protein [Caulobacteraceae bacterium]